MSEEWRAVPGYEGLYEVSNCGRVRSLDRVISYVNKCGYVSKRLYKGEIKEQYLSAGYHCVRLHKNGVGKHVRVHRIIAMAFIPNPHNYPCINHKDEDPTNNSISNLEWCTQSYNIGYGTCPKRIYESGGGTRRKVVEQRSLDGELVKTYESVAAAAKAIGLKAQTISACCNKRKKHKTAGGFKWNYKT